VCDSFYVMCQDVSTRVSFDNYGGNSLMEYFLVDIEKGWQNLWLFTNEMSKFQIKTGTSI
jgi:hypothetical protein